MSDLTEAPICAWCHAPVADGTARLRFFGLVYHLPCWDARMAAEMPRPEPRRSCQKGV
jgi:hypothetical protein